MKKGLLISATVFVIIGIIVFMSALIAGGFDIGKLGNAEYYAKKLTVSDKYNSILIDANTEEIRFKPSLDEKTKVELFEQDKIGHSVSVVDETLKIERNDERSWYDFLSFFNDRSTYITVYLPNSEYDKLIINSDTGDIDISSEASFADININTDTADVEIKGMKAVNISFSMSTGDIELDSILCSGVMSTKISTGETKINNSFLGDFVSNGSTGEVTLNNTIASGSVNIQTSTGDIELKNSDANELFIQTTTGDVTGSLISDKIFFTDTSTGDVEVPKSVSGGRCDIKTTTGDIKLSVNKRMYSEKIRSR